MGSQQPVDRLNFENLYLMLVYPVDDKWRRFEAILLTLGTIITILTLCIMYLFKYYKSVQDSSNDGSAMNLTGSSSREEESRCHHLESDSNAHILQSISVI